MNKQIIKANKEAFDWWLDGGKIIVGTIRFAKRKWMKPTAVIMWEGEDIVYLIDDEFIEYRKAQTEGKTVQWKITTEADIKYQDKKNNLFLEICTYRLKPDKPKHFWEPGQRVPG